MTHASLFSGIGGFDLAAEWMGWENVFHCEYDPFCQKVLAHHFPNSKLYDDVRTFDATQYRGRIDVLSGGFPCQPFSVAGQRKGTDDPRHLWPAMLRIIREIQPRYVLGENVRGLLNWSDGLVFEQVCTDLENEGYEVTPYILPACAVNAPHRRDRVWFVAHATSARTGQHVRGLRSVSERCSKREKNEGAVATDTDGTSVERKSVHEPGEGKPNRRNRCEIRNPWETFPTVAPICGPDDGISRRMDGITFPRWRSESIKGYGNAIVPQVAHQIFKSIHDTEILL
tara:strand:+ start:82 stop:936 length:855 start_codon:yes stop_codon:yes gene_type:complete